MHANYCCDAEQVPISGSRTKHPRTIYPMPFFDTRTKHPTKICHHGQNIPCCFCHLDKKHPMPFLLPPRTKHPMLFFVTPDKTSHAIYATKTSHAIYATPNKTSQAVFVTPYKTSHPYFKIFKGLDGSAQTLDL